jgi:hypothetical protein
LCVMSLMSMSKVIALAIVICLGDGNVRDVSDVFFIMMFVVSVYDASWRWRRP